MIKPRKGYSSVNTWIIHGEADLMKFLDSGFNKLCSYFPFSSPTCPLLLDFLSQSFFNLPASNLHPCLCDGSGAPVSVHFLPPCPTPLVPPTDHSLAGFDSALDLDIEVFIKGEMYHIDGFVHDNDIKLCWPSKYTNPCVDFNNSKYLASYSLLPTNPLRVKLQVRSPSS